MTEEFVNILTEAGPLGIFALYLIWQRQKDTQRTEELQEKFLKRLDDMDTRSDAAVSDLRDRYDKVISDYNKERTTLITGFGKLDQLIMRMGMTPAVASVPPPPERPKGPPDPGMTIQIERKVQEALDKMATKDEDEES